MFVRCLLLLLFIVNFTLNAQPTYNLLEEQGGGSYIVHKQHENCVSEQDSKIIWNKIERNRFQLNLQAKSNQIVYFEWPIRKASGLNYNSCYGISNFVDLNPTVGPNSWNSYGSTNLDYNCGNRTYDTNNGYNHSGTDIFTWPFPWYLYENSLVEVVAAASGVIIGKDDGNEDDHCDCFGRWNAVYIQHDDGSVTWYGHIKEGELTNKPVGSYVNQGEYLGIVASSGCSTGPHLHFEVYDPNGNLIDPYQGGCNNTTNVSWWENQKPYWEPSVNTLLTHYDVPQHGCPDFNEDPKISYNFKPGDLVYTAFYYYDQQAGDLSRFRILQPDGSIWQNWQHISPNTYTASWWYWSWRLPNNGPCGSWILEIDYRGSTYSHEFEVGSIPYLEINSSDDPEICEGDILVLTANSDPGVSYNWNTGDLSSNIQVSEEGRYYVTVTNASGCEKIDYIDVEVQYLDLSISPDSQVDKCEDEVIEIIADCSFDGDYEWNTSERQNNILVQDPGTYTVSFTSDEGCRSIQSIEVIDHPIDLNLTSTRPTEFCEGDFTVLIAESDYAESYRWSNGTRFQAITTYEPGLYIVTVTNEFGCDKTDSVEVIRHPIPIIEILPSSRIDICEGSFAQIEGLGGTSYQWSGPSGFSSSDAIIEVDVEGTYILEVENEFGCINEDSTVVDVHTNPIIDNIQGNIQAQALSIEVYEILNSQVNSIFTWNVTNGQIIAGQETESIQVSWNDALEGEICVEETDVFGCVSDLYCISIQISPTSLKELEPFTPRIFPNPVHEDLNIMTAENSVEIKVYDISGKQIELAQKRMDGNWIIDASAWNSGLYVLTVRSTKGFYIKKLVKI